MGVDHTKRTRHLYLRFNGLKMDIYHYRIGSIFLLLIRTLKIHVEEQENV